MSESCAAAARGSSQHDGQLCVALELQVVCSAFRRNITSESVSWLPQAAGTIAAMACDAAVLTQASRHAAQIESSVYAPI